MGSEQGWETLAQSFWPQEIYNCKHEEFSTQVVTQ